MASTSLHIIVGNCDENNIICSSISERIKQNKRFLITRFWVDLQFITDPHSSKKQNNSEHWIQFESDQNS